LSDPDLAFALSKGFSEQQTTEIFEKFTNYWWSAGAKATKRDWHKAWKVWVLGTRPMPRAGPSLITKQLSPFQQSKLETKDILDGLKAFAEGSGCSSSEHHRLLPGDNRQ
jgi:hypothetical protein